MAAPGGVPGALRVASGRRHVLQDRRRHRRAIPGGWITYMIYIICTYNTTLYNIMYSAVIFSKIGG